MILFGFIDCFRSPDRFLSMLFPLLKIAPSLVPNPFALASILHVGSSLFGGNLLFNPVFFTIIRIGCVNSVSIELAQDFITSVLEFTLI